MQKTREMCKPIILTSLMWLLASDCFAQQSDSTPFRAYLLNNEYEVYLRINFYDKNIEVPGQEIYGKLPGFLGKRRNSFCWVITSCKLEDEHTAELQMINDFGSEDLTATLTCINDSTYEFKQTDGSNLKVPHGGKWRKLPKKLTFKKPSRKR